MFNSTDHQGKTNQSYDELNLLPVRAVKSTTQEQQMLARMRRKGNPFALLVGMQTGAATVKISIEVSQKV